MRRREGDGCPVTGALQLIGDKWTLLIVRDLACAAKRTTELLSALHPISSRTLAGRLQDMQRDELIERRDYGGSPPHVEYELTPRGRLLLPLLDALKTIGERLDCNHCADRKERTGAYCDVCPHVETERPQRTGAVPSSSRREPDDSIVLL
ncbi:MAG: winged helix-turn-helix transcriptional regulator [Pyrinomonadaceae bacterium]